jgi:signal transduction histidine kinase/ligand-binding sensor domain-containing protein
MKTVLALVLLLLPAGMCRAVDHEIMPSRSHTIWDRSSGFPAGHIYSIAQTEDGYLWMGTGEGLLRYDGLSFAFIRRAPSNDQTNGLMPRVLTDSKGQLWVADDYTRLFRYKAGLLQGPVPDNSRHVFEPSAMCRSMDGWLLFVSLSQGVVEYQHGERRVLLRPGALPAAPTAIAQTSDGIVWIGTAEQGLFQFNPGKGDASLLPVPGRRNNRIDCLLSIATILLAGTREGLFSAYGSHALRGASPALAHQQILALAGGLNGHIWIGTQAHVFEANAKDLDAEGSLRSLDQLVIHANDIVTALFEDREGDLWIGEPETIERYQGNAFITYRSSSGLPCSDCGAIYADSRQGVWFAPRDGGLFRISQGKVQSIDVAGLKDDIVYSIAGAADEVWVARRSGGVTRLTLEGNSVRASTPWPQGESIRDAVYSLYREPDGTVWAGTLHQGLSRLRDGTWHSFTTKDGLPSDGILAITGNGSGEVFAGTADGLAEFTNHHWISFHTHDRLPPGAVESLLLDAQGTLWIGTARGLAYLRAGALHVPLGTPAALYGEILAIAEKGDWLWVTTPDRVLRVRRSALLKQAFTAGDCREFSSADGLPSALGIKRSPSVVADDRGNLWFSLKQGISLLPASAFANPAFPVTMRIDRMLLDNTAIATVDPVRIPSGPHRLTFQYVAIDVSNPERVRYRYRLADFDPSWSEPTSLREVDFTNTAPGPYEFQVAAINADGVWNEAAASMKFFVLPAFYQTNGFRVLCVFAFLMLLWAMYQLRLQQLHRQFDIALDARVGERTRIARELHDTLLQNFHGLMFQFQAASNLMGRKPEEAKRTLDDAINETKRALAQSRDAIQGLRSGPIAEGNLAELLKDASRELANSNADGHPPIFHLLEEGERRPLSSSAGDEISRIMMELMRNAYQHAHAERIEAEIRYQDSTFRLRFRDDGRGIDPMVLKEGGKLGHWGLRGMQERADRIGAHLDFWSEPGKGTEVQLLVPASIAYESLPDSLQAKLFRKVKTRAKRS